MLTLGLKYVNCGFSSCLMFGRVVFFLQGRGEFIPMKNKNILSTEKPYFFKMVVCMYKYTIANDLSRILTN